MLSLVSRVRKGVRVRVTGCSRYKIYWGEGMNKSVVIDRHLPRERATSFGLLEVLLTRSQILMEEYDFVTKARR